MGQKGGVYVFDISNPARPKQINFIRTSNDRYVGEGVQVIHIDTPAYQGDVLAMNNEICGAPNQQANGMTLVDATNPKVDKYLVEHAGDVAADGSVNQIHSVFMWDTGAKAYAVLVDDEEATDVDIMDITDPRNPVMVREYDLAAEFPQILQQGVGLDSVFLHDMIVKEVDGRQIMLVSYWDAGYVALDVTDPANADTYAIPEAHDPAFASGFGDLSVHEVAMSHEDSRLAYFSYYAGGFRVSRIDEATGTLNEVGHFIDTGGNNFWGVQVFEKNGKEYVAASDRDFGLYIFEYTGP